MIGIKSHPSVFLVPWAGAPESACSRASPRPAELRHYPPNQHHVESACSVTCPGKGGRVPFVREEWGTAAPTGWALTGSLHPQRRGCRGWRSPCSGTTAPTWTCTARVSTASLGRRRGEQGTVPVSARRRPPASAVPLGWAGLASGPRSWARWAQVPVRVPGGSAVSGVHGTAGRASAAGPVTPAAFSPSPPHGEVPEVRVSPALGRQCLQGGHRAEPGPDTHRAPPPEPRAVAAGGGQRAGRRAAGHRPDRLAEVRPRGRPVLGGWTQLWSRDHRPPCVSEGPLSSLRWAAGKGQCSGGRGENLGPSLTGGPQFVFTRTAVLCGPARGMAAPNSARGASGVSGPWSTLPPGPHTSLTPVHAHGPLEATCSRLT